MPRPRKINKDSSTSVSLKLSKALDSLKDRENEEREWWFWEMSLILGVGKISSDLNITRRRSKLHELPEFEKPDCATSHYSFQA